MSHRRTTLKVFLKHLGEKSNTHKTSCLQTVPVCRMEKIIPDMTKYKQLIKQLILYVPREGNIPQAHIYRKERLFTFSVGICWFWRAFWIFPFKDDLFKNNSRQEKCSWEAVQSTPFRSHPATHRYREVRQRKYSLDWFLLICPWKQKQTLINQSHPPWIFNLHLPVVCSICWKKKKNHN